MAEDRILPNLKTRLTLDSTEYAKGKQQADALRSSLADVGQGAKAGGDQVKSGLITPLRAATDAAQLFAARKIFDFGKAGFEELKGANIVTAQTTNLLRNLGPAAGASIDDVEKLSGAMLRQSGVDDELAQAAANTALRLGVQGDQMRRVVQDANDLSQSFGDINSDSELLSKALAKPEAAAKLLKPAIGSLTDAQVASIKAFQDHGDKASADGVILDAVETKVKGAAAAYGETLPGQVAIAQQSLANLRGELVGSLVPALSFATQGEQFLVDAVGNLPEPAKAAIGGVGLLAAGTISLARPVGDVVRLLQTWKERSEEVAAATAALAASEETEAAASAAGAASTASATGVTVASTAVTNEAALAAARRVVSNEALVFSDEEIAAAEQARQLAEYRSLVSNDALIAADLELVAANEAAAASAAEYAAANGALAGGSLTLGLGIAAAASGAGAAVGVYSALKEVWTPNVKGVDDLTAALEKNTGSQKENVNAAFVAHLGDLTHVLVAAGVSLDTVFRDVQTGTEDWGKLGRAVSKFADEDGARIPSQGHAIADALRDAGAGSSELGRQLIAGADAGKITGEQMTTLLNQIEGLHNGFPLATKAAAEHQQVQEAVTGTDQDAAAATETLTAKLEAERKAIDDAKAAAKALDDTFKAMVDGTVSAFEAEISLNDAQINTRSSLAELDKVSKDHKATQDDLAGATDKALSAILNEAQANEQVYESQVKAAGGAVSAATANTKLIEELYGVAATLAPNSPLKQQLADYITKLQAVPGVVPTTVALDSAQAVQAVLDFERVLNGIPVGVDLQMELRSGPGGRTQRAGGGPVRPDEVFRGAEQGFEILLNDGLYASTRGGTVLPHSVSADLLAQVRAPDLVSAVAPGAASFDDHFIDRLADRLAQHRGASFMIVGEPTKAQYDEAHWFALTKVGN